MQSYGPRVRFSDRTTSPAAGVSPVFGKSTVELLARFVQIESLTITPHTLPRHFVARAVILDLQPTQMVPAIIRVQEAIREQHPTARRTGWSGCSDGLYIYFNTL